MKPRELFYLLTCIADEELFIKLLREHRDDRIKIILTSKSNSSVER